MKYHLITYGCQMNTADSEEMSRPLEARGFLATADLQEADVVLMNTCTVRDQAEHRAHSNLGRLRVWKEKDPQRILIVAGCAASLWGESIKKRYPYIDLVAPATQIEKFPEVVAQVLKERWNVELENKESFETETHQALIASELTLPPSDLFGNAATAYVTIMRGCNYTCSYCIVPQVRGREVYRPLPEILAEIKSKVAAGLHEVMLLGQTVNSYYYREQASSEQASEEHLADVPGSLLAARRSLTFDFADLLRAVDAIEGVERIRFMSPHPRHMRDRVIEAMSQSPAVCRHIHLPVQSGSDAVLARMKRLYTREQYVSIVNKLRQAMPGILITTDLIVGYPGETETDFEASLALLEEVEFNGLFAFKFSARPETAAAGEGEAVPDAVKEERLQRVLALNKRIQRQTSAA